MINRKTINQIAYDIVNCAIEVHKELGPGLLENIYEESLFLELRNRNFFVQRQLELPVFYKGVECRTPLRIDLMVAEQIIVEVKSIDAIHPIHEAQLLTYMKLAEKPKGLLINFNVTNITKEGLKPMVNEIFKKLPEA